MFPGQILCSLWLFLLSLYHQSTMWVTFRWYTPSAQWREGIVRCSIVNTKSGRVRLLQWCKIALTYICCILCLPIVDTILQSRHAANSRTVLLMHIYDADACIRSRPGANSSPRYIYDASAYLSGPDAVQDSSSCSRGPDCKVHLRAVTHMCKPFQRQETGAHPQTTSKAHLVKPMLWMHSEFYILCSSA